MIKKIIDVSATWCGPCKAFKPVFENASNDYPDIEFVPIDVDTKEGEEICDRFGVRNVPTILFLDDKDQLLERATGNIGKEKFYEIINSHIV